MRAENGQKLKEKVNGRYKKTSRRMKKLGKWNNIGTPANINNIVKKTAEERQESSEWKHDTCSGSSDDEARQCLGR